MNVLTAAEGRRLLLALDASRCCPQDIALAVELASIVGGELEGLFVEDADLMMLAQLPFAREVGGRSGQDRPIVRESVESLVKRRVERAVGALERAGKLRNVPVTHRTTRGKVVQQALAQSERRDVLLLHPSTASAVQRGIPRPIMVWYENAEATAALDIAIALARMTSTELLVGVPSGRLGTERDVRAALSDRFASLAGRVRVRVHVLPENHADALIGAARSSRIAQLVLAADGELATATVLERLLAGIGSRLVLVR